MWIVPPSECIAESSSSYVASVQLLHFKVSDICLIIIWLKIRKDRFILRKSITLKSPSSFPIQLISCSPVKESRDELLNKAFQVT